MTRSTHSTIQKLLGVNHTFTSPLFGEITSYRDPLLDTALRSEPLWRESAAREQGMKDFSVTRFPRFLFLGRSVVVVGFHHRDHLFGTSYLIDRRPNSDGRGRRIDEADGGQCRRSDQGCEVHRVEVESCSHDIRVA